MIFAHLGLTMVIESVFMAHVARENNKRRNWPQKRQQEDAVSVALEGLIWANINTLIIQSHFVSNQ